MHTNLLSERSARDHEAVQKAIIDHLTQSHAQLLCAMRRLEALLVHPDFKLNWRGEAVTTTEALSRILSPKGAEGDFPPS